MKYLFTNILDFITENRSELRPVENLDSFNHLRPRRYSVETGHRTVREFNGKDGRRYYIVNKIDSTLFQVHDADELDRQIGARKPLVTSTMVADAVFDNTPIDHFTGFKENISIKVEPGHRRNGIATFIISFAEEILGKPYRPSTVLTDDMKEFTKGGKFFQ